MSAKHRHTRLPAVIWVCATAAALLLLADLLPTAVRRNAAGLHVVALHQTPAGRDTPAPGLPPAWVEAASPQVRLAYFFLHGEMESARAEVDGILEAAEPALSTRLDPNLAVLAGDVLYATGDTEEAMRVWREADAGRYWTMEALKAVDEGELVRATLLAGRAGALLRRASQDAPHWYHLADAYLRLAHYEAAAQSASLALEAASGGQEWVYDAYLLRGEALLGAGEAGAALDDFAAALERQPAAVMPLVRLCEAHSRLGQYEIASDACLEAVRRAPDFALARYFSGRNYYRQGAYEQAREEFAAAVRLDDQLDAAHDWLDRANEQLR
jgi:tetratricopeptide (TPR) repeat protein